MQKQWYNKLKQAGFVSPSIVVPTEYDVLFSVNPGSIHTGYCNVPTGGVMSRKQLLELAAYFKIAGKTKMNKEELVANIKKAQKKAKRGI